jgi:hypothetical protein
MYAAYYGREESLRELVDAGADIHLQNEVSAFSKQLELTRHLCRME